MVAKNDQYKYESIPDAFKKITSENGMKGMYKGYIPFLINYVSTFGIQMVIYESYMD